MSNFSLSVPIATQIEALISPIKKLTDSKQVTQGDPCWSPPLFPEQGRLPLSSAQISDNFLKLRKEEGRYRKLAIENCMACVKNLHVSLFFDGTNNNEKNDTKAAHPSNVAKLYHACAPNDDRAMERGFYAYYMPGVGTPFPEIGTNEYYSPGLQFSVGGEARISWALINICDVLYREVNKETLTTAKRRAALRLMSSNTNYDSTTLLALSDYDPIPGLMTLLSPIKEKIARHIPKLTALKLYVYGFSRGAAEARAFVYWVNQLLEKLPSFSDIPDAEKTLYGLPISVEFLGLFDTVAAVGFANVVPIATGHNSWAGGTQQLPKSDLVKTCCHLVSAHEQRQAFALDSVRTPEGIYPPSTVEVIYPGMHSDVGGGYPMGDQGKARDSAGELLSQIALHDMYAAAFDAGAPLAISEMIFTSLHSKLQRQYAFRKMAQGSEREFTLSNLLIDKFNTWVKQTLPETTPAIESTKAAYTPIRFVSHDLERVMEAQLVLMTAWRIGRYGSAQSATINLTHLPFFQTSSQHADISAQPYEPAFSHQATEAIITEYNLKDQELAKIAKERKKEQEEQSDLDSWVSKNIGTPMFDATNGRGQLWEASLEFKADYEDHPRPAPLIDMSSRKTQAECLRDTQQWIGMAANNACASLPKYSFPVITAATAKIGLQNLDGSIEEIVYAITYQNERGEYEQLKKVSTQLFQDVISPYLLGHTRRNSEMDNIIALFDDHIHDSRAWFMHSESGVREPFGGYFLSRMIYFGDHWNKSMTLIVEDKKLVQTAFPMTPTAQLALYYLPTYGLRLMSQQTGETVSFEGIASSIETNKIMPALRVILEKAAQAREAEIQQNIMDFLNKSGDKVLTN
ncbi:hypothetical protein C9446_09850 [Providencia heimbachae]|uniref:T6SS phospholipase effector Tle1-like catalytic domain-containing protein n=1 Tax=Providencia heimbachae TaxID=333962 RepID=UPI0010BE8744|nr:DUF2235 domain-containing protein [Providencia heimbachae]QCJ70126.1 hypothetical protein C9446_09850 [Providencia heimbachae]